jgi:hypothetical protein
MMRISEHPCLAALPLLYSAARQCPYSLQAMNPVQKYPLPLFFVLAYAISWTVWCPLWLPRFGVTGLPVLPYHTHWAHWVRCWRRCW